MSSTIAKACTRRMLALAAGCLGAAIAATSAGAADKVRVANFPNVVVAPVFHAMDRGYFKDAGIEIEIVKVATGPASVSAVASGQADVGWAAATVPLFARSNGVPVKIFMAADKEGPPDHLGLSITASGKSGINTIAEIKGKTVMINAFGTATELAIRERLQLAGVSWDEVKKVVVPFPQMPAALEQGNADVAVTIYPMQAAIMANKAIGAKLLSRGNLSVSSKQVVIGSCYFATDAWLAANQKLALAFGRTYQRAAQEILADPKLRLDLVMKLSGMEKAVAETVPPSWYPGIGVTQEEIAPIHDALVRTGMMSKSFQTDEVIAALPF